MHDESPGNSRTPLHKKTSPLDRLALGVYGLFLRLLPRDFRVVGVPPVLGRPILPEENRPDGDPVAVVSYEFWTSALGAEDDLASGAPLLLLMAASGILLLIACTNQASNLLIRSLQEIVQADTGFEAQGVPTLELDP